MQENVECTVGSEKISFPPIGARVANIDIVNRFPSKNSGTVISLNLTDAKPFAEVAMDDGRTEICFGLAELGCGWYRPLSDQSPTYIELELTMRSKTTFGTDKETIRVLSGQSVKDVAERIARGYGAELVEIRNPDGTIYEEAVTAQDSPGPGM